MDVFVNQEILLPEVVSWGARREVLSRCRRGDETSRWILDFSATRDIDAIGLGLILHVLDLVGKERKRVCLVRAQGLVLDTLIASGLDKLAHIGYPEEM